MSHQEGRRDMAMRSERLGSRVPVSAAGVGRDAPRSVIAWQVLSALFLLAMGAIHLYLIVDGVGGTLGKLFVLNVVGAFVLAVAAAVLRGRPLPRGRAARTGLTGCTLRPLVLALTRGLFGIHAGASFTWGPIT